MEHHQGPPQKPLAVPPPQTARSQAVASLFPPRPPASQERQLIGLLSDQVSLVQAALAMALGGTARAQVREIIARAEEEFGVTLTPSEAGQFFASHGLATTTTRGRNRLVLDVDLLRALLESLGVQADALRARNEGIFQRAHALGDRVQELEVAVQRVNGLRLRYQELNAALQSQAGLEERVAQMEKQAAQAQRRAERAETLAAEIQELDEKAAGLPDLESRRRALKERLEVHERDEAELLKKEQALGTRIATLQERNRWTTAAELSAAIDAGKQELDQLMAQLGEKRSRLARLFGRSSEKEA